MEFIRVNTVVVIFLLLIVAYFIKRMMNRDGERGYISGLFSTNREIKKIEVNEDYINRELINKYLEDEYKIKGNQEEYNTAYNLLIKFILNEYIQDGHTLKHNELKNNQVYIMLRIYNYYIKLLNSYGSRKNNDFELITRNHNSNYYDSEKQLNEAGIVLMKMFLSSMNYIKQNKLKADMRFFDEERIKRSIEERKVIVN